MDTTSTHSNRQLQPDRWISSNTMVNANAAAGALLVVSTIAYSATALSSIINSRERRNMNRYSV